MTLYPHITVLMSVYNGAQHLIEAIDSILRQSFKVFEFLIINDGSTDNSRAIVAAFSDPRIRLIDNERNLGLSSSLNRGIAAAGGTYIARMDADDIAPPDRLARQFEFMEAHPDVDVCGGWYARFGSRTKATKTPVSDRDIKDTLFFYNCIAHPSVMLRTRSFHHNGLHYCEDFQYSQDYELWCREIDQLKFFNIPEIILHYRIHDTQAGSREKERQDAAADIVRKRNVQRLGLCLNEDENRLFGHIIRQEFFSAHRDTVIDALRLLDTIGTRGANSHGPVFSDIIRKHMWYCAEAGIQRNEAPLSIFRSILLKWNVYPAPARKVRYLYHALKSRMRTHCT